MGNFEEHIQYGIAAHILGVVILTGLVYSNSISIITWLTGVGLVPITISGAIFPDIDHHASKPNKIFKYILFIITSTLAGFIYGKFGWNYLQIKPSVLTGTAVLVSVLIGILSVYIFSYIRPPHRGPTHRVPVGILIALLATSGTWYVIKTISVTATFIAPTVGGLFFLGFISHLQCDSMLLKKKTYLTLS